MRKKQLLIICLLCLPLQLAAQYKWKVDKKIDFKLDFIDTNINKQKKQVTTIEVKITNRTSSNIFITDIAYLNENLFSPWSRHDSVFFDIGVPKNEMELSDFKTLYLTKIKAQQTLRFTLYVYFAFLNPTHRHIFRINYLENSSYTTRTKPHWLMMKNKKKKRIQAEYIISKFDYQEFCQIAVFHL